jgi:hypothetical protein
MPSRRTAVKIPLIVAFGAALVVAGCNEKEQDPSPTDVSFIPFLAQSECVGAGGAPLVGVLPFEAECQNQRAAVPGHLPYRRIDWSGVQASDAVLLPSGAIAQTFDFGDAPRAFGRLDRGLGDGGDLVVITPSGVGIEQTEDGGAGRQWWRDPFCRQGAGWLLFEGQPTTEWRSRVSQLGMVRNAEDCARDFSFVYTRWRQQPVELPWRDNRGGEGAVVLNSIISEHFAGTAINNADHMERFVFSEGIGKTLWQRWEHSGRTHRNADELRGAIAAMEGDNRCPVAGDVPAPGWVLADCRVWMNFDRAGGQWMAWP